MINKKGFIRTIEALIAIVLLLGLIVFIYSGNAKKLLNTPEVVDKASSFIINEFLNKPEFRTCFLNAQTQAFCKDGLSVSIPQKDTDCKPIIINFIEKSIPPGYNYECEICPGSKSCTTITAPKDVSIYPKSGFIYTITSPRVVRLYLYSIKK